MGIVLLPRTATTIRGKGTVPIDALEREEVRIPLWELNVLSYRCIDCDYETVDIEEMRYHQASYRHTFWRRVKRWLGIM